MDIAAETTVANLRAVGCAVEPAAGRAHRRPRRRGAPDLTDPYDLVEEVARIVGYDERAVRAAARRRRPRPHPRASGCAAGSAARWPARATSR